MNLNKIAQAQFVWVEDMKWHNKTVLESLALIASEIGEAAYEHLDSTPTEHFGEELADIMLRSLDLACWQKVDLNNEVEHINFNYKYEDVPRMFMQLTFEFGNLVNTARKTQLEQSFHTALALFIKAVLIMAEKSQINLEKEILNKMEINLQRGTRGRIV